MLGCLHMTTTDESVYGNIQTNPEGGRVYDNNLQTNAEGNYTYRGVSNN